VSGKNNRSGPNVSWTLVLAIASVVALAIAYRASPEDSTIRKVVRTTPDVVAALPERAKQLKLGLRDRVRQARNAFQLARSDSEQSLLAQLSVSKQRGSQPPICGTHLAVRLAVVGFLISFLLTVSSCDSLGQTAPAATSVPPTVEPAPTATNPAPTPVATTTPPPAPTASPVPTATPVALIVGKTDGDGIWIRASPPVGDKLKAWPDGTSMVVVGPDQTVMGKTWKNVRDPDGNVGWVAGEYLLTAADAAADQTKVPIPLPAGATPPIVTATPG